MSLDVTIPEAYQPILDEAARSVHESAKKVQFIAQQLDTTRKEMETLSAEANGTFKAIMKAMGLDPQKHGARYDDESGRVYVQIMEDPEPDTKVPDNVVPLPSAAEASPAPTA